MEHLGASGDIAITLSALLVCGIGRRTPLSLYFGCPTIRRQGQLELNKYAPRIVVIIKQSGTGLGRCWETSSVAYIRSHPLSGATSAGSSASAFCLSFDKFLCNNITLRTFVHFIQISFIFINSAVELAVKTPCKTHWNYKKGRRRGKQEAQDPQTQWILMLHNG